MNENEQPVNNGRSVQYAKGTHITMYACGLFFAWCAFMAWKFPGRTNPSDLPWVISVFIGFSVTGFFTAWLMHRCKIRWNKDIVSGSNMWGKRAHFHWNQIADLEHVEALDMWKLTADDGSVIHFYPAMKGFDPFMDKVNEELRRAGKAIRQQTKLDDGDSQ